MFACLSFVRSARKQQQRQQQQEHASREMRASMGTLCGDLPAPVIHGLYAVLGLIEIGVCNGVWFYVHANIA